MNTVRTVIALLGLALMSAACTPASDPAVTTTTTTVASSPVYGQECAAFQPDPEHPFFPVGKAPLDPEPLVWETADPGDGGFDQAVLDAAADNVALSEDVASMLVVSDGKLVFERYFNGNAEDQANDVHSLSKSVLSLLTGIAIDDGLVTLDTRIDEVLPPGLVGEHGDLTVESLLTMSGGLAMPEVDLNYEWEPSDEPNQPSLVEAVLKEPSVATPGSEFVYNTGLTQVLSAVVTEATGQSLCTFAAERLLGPMGIDVEKWWVEPGRYFSGGYGLFLTPREVARLGQMVLQHGIWEGSQLVSSQWLDESLAERWDRGCRGVQPVHQGYGYLWWRYDVNGHQVWNASGYGGNDLYIVPDEDLLLVLTHDTLDVPEEELQVVPGLGVLRRYLLDDKVGASPDPCAQGTLQAHTIRPDGTGQAPVANWPSNTLATSWSPDGSALLVSTEQFDLNSEIYTFAPTGVLIDRLTFDFAFDAMAYWSPDGSLIALMRGDPGASDLYVMRADGADEIQLTDYDGYEQSPSWSPDGQRIAFVWGHKETRALGDEGELWVVGSDGSDPTLILDHSIAYPDWSPDGQHIAVWIQSEDPHVGVFDLSTGVLTDLGEGAVARWSPDGTRLAFISERDGDWDLYTMDADGGNVQQLTNDPAFDTFPIWSPDGATIMFQSRDDG